MEDQTMETTAESYDFDAFMEADGGAQTEAAPEVQEETAAAEEPAGETEDSTENSSSEDSAADSSPEAASEDPGQTFTIKVNKEQRTVSRDEVIALAQKGSDYDRVKEQLARSQQSTQELQAKLREQQELMGLLNMIAGKSGLKPEQMVENLYINLQKANGVDEGAAREALRADRLQRELDAIQEQQKKQHSAQEDQQERARKEIAEFRKEYPGIELTEDLVKQMMPDVQGGMTMVSAYRKAESARKDAQIAELQKQLAAEKQNKKNRTASPGSQRDSGGKRQKDAFDDFMEAFA